MAMNIDPELATDSVVMSDDEEHHVKHGVHRRIRAKSTILNYEKILGTLDNTRDWSFSEDAPHCLTFVC